MTFDLFSASSKNMPECVPSVLYTPQEQPTEPADHETPAQDDPRYRAVARKRIRGAALLDTVTHLLINSTVPACRFVLLRHPMIGTESTILGVLSAFRDAKKVVKYVYFSNDARKEAFKADLPPNYQKRLYLRTFKNRHKIKRGETLVIVDRCDQLQPKHAVRDALRDPSGWRVGIMNTPDDYERIMTMVVGEGRVERLDSHYISSYYPNPSLSCEVVVVATAEKLERIARDVVRDRAQRVLVVCSRASDGKYLQRLLNPADLPEGHSVVEKTPRVVGDGYDRLVYVDPPKTYGALVCRLGRSHRRSPAVWLYTDNAHFPKRFANSRKAHDLNVGNYQVNSIDKGMYAA